MYPLDYITESKRIGEKIYIKGEMDVDVGTLTSITTSYRVIKPDLETDEVAPTDTDTPDTSEESKVIAGKLFDLAGLTERGVYVAEVTISAMPDDGFERTTISRTGIPVGS
jgi:hypothetical protein